MGTTIRAEVRGKERIKFIPTNSRCASYHLKSRHGPLHIPLLHFFSSYYLAGPCLSMQRTPSTAKASKRHIVKHSQPPLSPYTAHSLNKRTQHPTYLIPTVISHVDRASQNRNRASSPQTNVAKATPSTTIKVNINLS